MRCSLPITLKPETCHVIGMRWLLISPSGQIYHLCLPHLRQPKPLPCAHRTQLSDGSCRWRQSSSEVKLIALKVPADVKAGDFDVQIRPYYIRGVRRQSSPTHPLLATISTLPPVR